MRVRTEFTLSGNECTVYMGNMEESFICMNYRKLKDAIEEYLNPSVRKRLCSGSRGEKLA